MQDVLNVAFKGRWATFDIAWNAQGLGSYAGSRTYPDLPGRRVPAPLSHLFIALLRELLHNRGNPELPPHTQATSPHCSRHPRWRNSSASPRLCTSQGRHTWVSEQHPCSLLQPTVVSLPGHPCGKVLLTALDPSLSTFCNPQLWAQLATLTSPPLPNPGLARAAILSAAAGFRPWTASPPGRAGGLIRYVGGGGFACCVLALFCQQQQVLQEVPQLTPTQPSALARVLAGSRAERAGGPAARGVGVPVV